jgi:hypothetical protein
MMPDPRFVCFSYEYLTRTFLCRWTCMECRESFDTRSREMDLPPKMGRAHCTSGMDVCEPRRCDKCVARACDLIADELLAQIN